MRQRVVFILLIGGFLGGFFLLVGRPLAAAATRDETIANIRRALLEINYKIADLRWVLGKMNQKTAAGDQPASRLPMINSLAPSSGRLGSKVVISGENFTPTGNIVYTGFDTFTNLPSPDGRSLSITIASPNLDFPANFGELITADFPELRFRFYVKNENGVSARPAEFMLKLK